MNFRSKTDMFGLTLTFLSIMYPGLTLDIKHVNLLGAGATFPQEVYNVWTAAYKSIRRDFVSVVMKYDALGSGHGKGRIKGEIEPLVQYAGSDSILKSADYALYPDLQMFPTMAGPLVLSYNLPGITTLVLSPEAIVGIYNGTILYWNDTLIQDQNPSVSLPYQQVIPCARKEKSGTTEIFTRALSSFSTQWHETYGHFSQGVNASGIPIYWDNSVVQCFGKRITGIADEIKDNMYSIGYTSALLSTQVGLPYAALINRAGNVIKMNSTSVQSAMNDMSLNMQSDLTSILVDPPGEWSYPISGYTYMIVKKSTMENCDSAVELIRYILWFLQDDLAKEDTLQFQMIPVSDTVVARIKTEVVNKMTCNGHKVIDLLDKQLYDEWLSRQKWRTPVFIIAPIVGVIIILLVTYLVFQKVKYLKLLDSDAWIVKLDDISFQMPTNSRNSSMTTLFSQKSFTFQVLPAPGDLMFDTDVTTWQGRWNDYTVALRIFPVSQVSNINKECTRMMIWIRENIIHDNVVKFFGLTQSEKIRYSVSEYSSRGCLSDILQTDKFKLGDSFPYSVTKDVVAGMKFLHRKGIVHGNLRSTCCLIDTKWSVKIVMWEFTHLYSSMMLSGKMNEQLKHSAVQYVRKLYESEGEYAMHFNDFWTAPEILLSDYKMTPTKACDVYSFAIILQEIFTKEDPYFELTVNHMPKEVVQMVRNRKVRPVPSQQMPAKMKQIMQTCWKDKPVERMTFEEIATFMKKANPYKNISVLDNMMKAMDEYMNALEVKVEGNSRYDVALSQTIPEVLLSPVINGTVIEPDVHEASLLLICLCNKNSKSFKSKTDEDMLNISTNVSILVQGQTTSNKLQLIYKNPTSWLIYAGKYTSHGRNASDSLINMMLALYEKDLSCSDKQNPKMINDIKLPAKQILGAALFSGQVISGVENQNVLPHFTVHGQVVNDIMGLSDDVTPGCVLVNNDVKSGFSHDARFMFKAANSNKNKDHLYVLHCDSTIDIFDDTRQIEAQILTEVDC